MTTDSLVSPDRSFRPTECVDEQKSIAIVQLQERPQCFMLHGDVISDAATVHPVHVVTDDAMFQTTLSLLSESFKLCCVVTLRV